MKKTAEQIAADILSKQAQYPYEVPQAYEELQRQASPTARGVALGLTGAGLGATLGMGGSVYKGLKSKHIGGMARQKILSRPWLQTPAQRRLVKGFQRRSRLAIGKGGLLGAGIGTLLGVGSGLLARRNQE